MTLIYMDILIVLSLIYAYSSDVYFSITCICCCICGFIVLFYFPNGRYIDWLSFTNATNKSKAL